VEKYEVIPLGGIGEFGMNCMAIRYADEMIIVDVGMGFPEDAPYGVDICIPNFDFLEQYRDELTALILTHGHEDHIGALPYFLKRFNIPVYSSRFTLALTEKRLDEHGMTDSVLLHRVEANETVEINNFKIEFIPVTHSLVECFVLAITTPAGTIIHTGDYKIDDTPVIGKQTDLATLRKYGDAGVLALFGDSTNSTVPGRTPSEQAVIPAFDEIFEQAEGRIIISTFSSSLHRLQVVFDAAEKFGRKVCILGRSMLKNVEIASDLRLLDISPNLIVSLGDSRQYDDDEIVYLVTGSQGEFRAALWNMAATTYKGLEIERGDTVVLSARIIPGNEKNISRLIGNIYKRGGNIIEEQRRLIHVSGHASQEDIKIMVEAVRPRHLIPIHGEYRMLFRQEEFVKNHLGYDAKNIILIENGDVLEIDKYGARVTEKHEIGRTFIDEEGLNEIDYETVRERKKLAYGGILTVVVTIDERSKEVLDLPSVTLQGVAGDYNLKAIADAVETEISNLPKEAFKDKAILKENLRIFLKRQIQKETGAKPVILPTIIEV
jgi:ribonuclease J